MDKLLTLIDNEIEASTAQLAADTIKFVNIKSVKSEPMPGAPFGEGVEKMLNTFWRWQRPTVFSAPTTTSEL
jgi:hypothetical protein